MSPSQISPTAIISKKAELGNNITVGPYSIIGDQVTIGDNGVIMHHSVIDRNTRIGENFYDASNTNVTDSADPGETKYLDEIQIVGDAKDTAVTDNDGSLVYIVRNADGLWIHDIEIGAESALTAGATASVLQIGSDSNANLFAQENIPTLAIHQTQKITPASKFLAAGESLIIRLSANDSTGDVRPIIYGTPYPK